MKTITPKTRKSQSAKPRAPRMRITKLGTERLVALDAKFKRNWAMKAPDLKYPDAEELAVEFGVNEKTIREDVQFMRERLNLPAQYIARHRGFGYTEEVTSFPLTQLSQGDVFFFCAAISALESFRGIPLSDHAGGAFEKILQGLDQNRSISPQQIRQLISFRPMSYHAIVKHEAFELVSRVLFDREELRFTYNKLSEPGPANSPDERLVQPRHLACIESSWYLFANVKTDDEPRTFALSRMSNVQATGKRFRPRKPFDIEQALDSAFNAYCSGKRIDVRVRFTGIGARLIAERRYHDARALIHNPDGSIDLIRRVAPSPQIPGWVLSFGADAEVISPQSIKDEVAKTIRQLHSRLGH